MRVAVTGGSGFVGGHLIEALRRRDRAVRALARTDAAARRLEAAGCDVVDGALDDAAALAKLVDGTSAVFHVAGLVAGREESEFVRVNVDGAGAVARAAADAGGCRVIHVSSLAAAGPSAPGQPLDEHAPPRPLTPYGRSKLAGEAAVRASGAAYTIVRPPIVYGPRDRALLPLFRMARRAFVPRLGSGAQELSLVWAADLADALVAVAATPACAGQTYHAGHAEIVSQARFVDAIVQSVGRRALTPTLPSPAVRLVFALTEIAGRCRGRATMLSREKADEILAPAWTATSDALTRATGWRAATPLAVGVPAVAQWYREAGWL